MGVYRTCSGEAGFYPVFRAPDSRSASAAASPPRRRPPSLALCRARELAAQADAPAAAAAELVMTCPVCFDEIDADSDPVATACRHLYCRKCIVDWVSTREATCPLCRGPLDGASGQLTAVPLPAAADASTAPWRSCWRLREWRQAGPRPAKIRYSYLLAPLRDWRQNHTSIRPEGLRPAPACPACAG